MFHSSIDITDKNLPIDVIKKNIPKLSTFDIIILSRHHNLTKKFIKCFDDCDDDKKCSLWYGIESRDDLSENFVRKYYEELDLLVVAISNDHLSDEFIEEMNEKKRLLYV